MGLCQFDTVFLRPSYKIITIIINMAPSFSAMPLIIQMEDFQVINMYRGPCYLGIVFLFFI